MISKMKNQVSIYTVAEAIELVIGFGLSPEEVSIGTYIPIRFIDNWLEENYPTTINEKSIIITKQEKKNMKTLEQFENQPEGKEVDLDEFLGMKPIEIDEQLYYHIVCAYTAAHCSYDMGKQYHVDQGGDAVDSINNMYGDELYTYSTVSMYPDNTYWYLGILPDLQRDDF